jgi:pimeloyl-ACP methyl ester carboxylesterase
MSGRATRRRRRRWAIGIALLAVAAVGGLVGYVQHPLQTLAFTRRRALARAGFERVELGSGESRLTVFAAGRGPALLFLHGLGDQAGSWKDIAPAFTDRYRVVVADLAGHGDSAPAEGVLPMATLVAGAERVLAYATAEGPAIVVGNSMGAWLGTLLAHRQPENVARIVLVNGGALLGEPGGPSLVPKNRAEAAQLMGMLRDSSSPKLPGFVLDDIVRRSGKGPLGRASLDVAGLFAHLLDGRLGEVATPVDLLWGAADQVVPLRYAERLLAALPAARLTRIENCGHVPQVECPERFRRALAAILAGPPPVSSPTAAKSPEATL